MNRAGTQEHSSGPYPSQSTIIYNTIYNTASHVHGGESEGVVGQSTQDHHQRAKEAGEAAWEEPEDSPGLA